MTYVRSISILSWCHRQKLVSEAGKGGGERLQVLAPVLPRDSSSLAVIDADADTAAAAAPAAGYFSTSQPVLLPWCRHRKSSC